MRRLYEGRARRAFTHIGSPYGYLSSIAGSVGGRNFGEGPLTRRGLRRKQERTGSPLQPFDPAQYKAVGGVVGDWAGRQTGALGGGALSAGIQGKDVYALDTAKDPVKAGKEYTKKHRVSAAFVLPKNKYEMTKLANRDVLGHAGHGALRFMFGGPVNVARYGAKVSYARSGYRRENTNMRRDGLFEAKGKSDHKLRRAASHWVSPHAFVGRSIGGMLGQGMVAGGDPYDNRAYAARSQGRIMGTIGGAIASRSHQDRDINALNDTNSPIKAGKEYAQKHKTSAVFILPKNEFERNKLANRSVAGHVGHGILRVAGGPLNIARYATKVDYAKSGYHRGEDAMTRDDLIEAIVEASFADAMVIPKNKFERDKLTNRSTLGHVGHGALRYMGGAWAAAPATIPLAMSSPGLSSAVHMGGGIANVVRYAKKVKNAKLGKHREQKEYRDR